MLSTSSFSCAFFKCSNLDAMSLESYTLEAGCCLHLSFSNKQEGYFQMHMVREGGGSEEIVFTQVSIIIKVGESLH